MITNGFSAVIGMFSKKRAKSYKPDDFMGKDAKKVIKALLEPEEKKDWGNYIQEARAKGLRGPGE